MTPELYDKAIKLKVQFGGLSIVLLQYKLKVSHAMAKMIMEAVDAKI